MKSIECPNCGSNDLYEENGYILCRYCGAKLIPTAEDVGAKQSTISLNADVQRLLQKCKENPERAARNELTSRKAVEDGNTFLVDKDDVQVYLTGKHTIESYESGNSYLYLEAVVINNTDKNIGIGSDTASVNGWNVDFLGTTDVSFGKKKKDNFELRISDADISSYEEVEELEISLVIYDCDSYDTMFTSDSVIVTFN